MARLPSLNALRAFESAGRHLSFTRAAEELHVTQGAVSHQIRSLEDQLGLQLFRRGHRQLLLTDCGQVYLPEVRAAFDRLEAATARLTRQVIRSTLTIAVLPSLAARWLVPRLRHFWAAHPQIDVRISATEAPVDFDRDDVDLGIFWGDGRYPGLVADLFLTEIVFAVCSPTLMAGSHPLREPEDLRFHTLLHDDGPADWPTWLRAAGTEQVEAGHGPRFNDASMVLQAALDGQGVALTRSVLAAEDLAGGRLVRPFALTLPSSRAYHIVYPERAASNPKFRALRDWLLSEAGTRTASEKDPPAG